MNSTIHLYQPATDALLATKKRKMFTRCHDEPSSQKCNDFINLGQLFYDVSESLEGCKHSSFPKIEWDSECNEDDIDFCTISTFSTSFSSKIDDDDEYINQSDTENTSKQVIESVSILSKAKHTTVHTVNKRMLRSMSMYHDLSQLCPMGIVEQTKEQRNTFPANCA